MNMKKRNEKMRRAFTLVELMVVIALMGVMGTMAVGGYNAVTRGMSDRAALNAANSLAEAALQRAQIDRAPTYVYLFDEMTRLESDTAPALVQGVMVAVRPCGRVTRVDGDLVCDEFGDLDRAFKSLDGATSKPTAGDEEDAASVMRIYNITQGDYANVYEGFFSKTIGEKDLEEGDNGTQVYWTIYGFKRKSGSGFAVGDEYGQEFAVTRLPPGYVFSKTANTSSTSSLGLTRVGGVLKLRPNDTALPSVTVYARRAAGTESVGSISSVKDAAGES